MKILPGTAAEMIVPVIIQAEHLLPGMLVITPDGPVLGEIERLEDGPRDHSHPNPKCYVRRMYFVGGRKAKVSINAMSAVVVDAATLPEMCMYDVTVRAKFLREGFKIRNEAFLKPKSLAECARVLNAEIRGKAVMLTLAIEGRQADPDPLLEPIEEWSCGMETGFKVDPVSIPEYAARWRRIALTNGDIPMQYGKLCGPWHLLVDTKKNLHCMQAPKFEDYTYDPKNDVFHGAPDEPGMYECFCVPEKAKDDMFTGETGVKTDYMILNVEKCAAFIPPSQIDAEVANVFKKDLSS